MEARVRKEPTKRVWAGVLAPIQTRSNHLPLKPGRSRRGKPARRIASKPFASASNAAPPLCKAHQLHLDLKGELEVVWSDGQDLPRLLPPLHHWFSWTHTHKKKTWEPIKAVWTPIWEAGDPGGPFVDWDPHTERRSHRWKPLLATGPPHGSCDLYVPWIPAEKCDIRMLRAAKNHKRCQPS